MCYIAFDFDHKMTLKVISTVANLSVYAIYIHKTSSIFSLGL